MTQGIFYTGDQRSSLLPSEGIPELKRSLTDITKAQIPDPSVLKRLQFQHKFDMLSMGTHHVLARTDTGRLFSWGLNEFGVLGVENNPQRLKERVSVPERVCMGFQDPPGIVFVLATESASIAINFNGRVFYWGR